MPTSPFGPIQHFDGFGQLNSVSGSTGTLPAGLALGQPRWESGVLYRLFCNATTQSAASGGYGFKRLAGSAATGNGFYSVTISTTTESASNIACVCPNSVATGFYFWGAVQGFPVYLKVSNISVASGALVMPAANGKFTLTATATVAVGLNVGDTTTATAISDSSGGQGGRFFVNFEPVVSNLPLAEARA